MNISEANHFDANITLLDDLDFSGSALTLPFGFSSDYSSCVSYTGVFEGNGHTIKGLVMNNEDNQECPMAGLFCGLENAIFENLVIDSSCSFTGSSAGALSVSLAGSLTVTNVTNKADVSGSYEVGGFVGIIGYLNQRTEVAFKDCVNDGNITGWSMLGGFVGDMKNNKDLSMTFSDCINNGNNSGKYIVGGFVGKNTENENMKITISNCTNNGICTGESGHVGGFVGSYASDDVTINISNFVNNGLITGDNSIGGFFGSVRYINTNITISNSMNTGMITGISSYIGGFVGRITTGSESSLNPFVIINSANKGNVSTEYFACGMFCVDSDNAQNLYTVVLNSINKGSVNATASAYGITNTITKARNVVSMGEVNASSGSSTFWSSDDGVEKLYGLAGKCINCYNSNIRLFEHNTSTGFYEVVGSGEHVNYLLNAEVQMQNFGMFWTEELDLVEPHVEPSPLPLPSPASSLSSSSSSQSGGLSGGNKHGVSLFWIGVVVALAAHVAMAQ